MPPDAAACCCPYPPLPGNGLHHTKRRAFRLAPEGAHGNGCCGGFAPPSPESSRRVRPGAQTCRSVGYAAHAKRHGIAFISSAAILYSISTAASSGMKSPPRMGRATVCRKSLAEFRGRSREINFNHFRRRRVRRRKYFSRSGVSNCPPLADNRGAERSAGPFVEEGRAFFDKMKPAPNGTGRVFKRCRQAPCPGRARARRGS